VLGELEGERWRPFAKVAEIPIAFGGAARHNVANALAAAAGARAMGASIEAVGDGLRDFRPSMDAAPGRLNVFRKGDQLVIIDFAHNEAGLSVLLDVAEAIAGGRRPITAIVGTAGDRPDDTLRGMGRIAAQRADRVVIKESIHYLRGRSRESFIGEIRAGAKSAGWRGEVPVYETEVGALSGELDRPSTSAAPIVLLLTHDSRDDVFAELKAREFDAVDATADLSALVASR
jgi:cyanophycin synthetase